jgi:hypothetical protein
MNIRSDALGWRTHISDSGGAPSNSIRPALNAKLKQYNKVYRDARYRNRKIRTPVASALGPRSCQTKTQPDLR